MKITVKKDACIGCGACTGIDDELFEIGDDGLSSVKNDVVPVGKEEQAKDAIKVCPTDAIVEVE